MKALIGFVAVFLSSSPLFSQIPAFASRAACGDGEVSMAVKLDSTQHAMEPPEPGTARIYFIQDRGEAPTVAYPTTKIGIDGKWAGANKKDSYFSVSVEPGEHHLCAAIQSSIIRQNLELAHLTAEAGQVYYYRTRIIYSRDGLEYFSFIPVDSDEAKYLIELFPLATAHARK